MYLWTGPIDQRPSCEALHLSKKDFGFTEAIAQNICPLCTCDPPTGSCSLPTVFMAGAPGCPQGGSQMSFNAPAGWDGTCDSSNPLLGGPGFNCFGIEPVKLVLEGCTPHASTVPTDENAIKFTAAVACAGNSARVCSNGNYCLPTMDATTPNGFVACIAAAGDQQCPSEYKDERHVVYHGFIDDRACSPCTCGAPKAPAAWGYCSAEIFLYSDDFCGKMKYGLLVTEVVNGPWWCYSYFGDVPLLSKSATPPVFTPGSCQPSGGDPSGDVVGDAATSTTYCCRRAST